MEEDTIKQPTAMSAERYILMHKIKTIQWLSFISGVSFGMLLGIIIFNLVGDK